MRSGKLFLVFALGAGCFLACLGLLTTGSPPATHAAPAPTSTAAEDNAGTRAAWGLSPAGNSGAAGPSIVISKTTVTSMPVVSGSDVMFQIAVENNGDVALVLVLIDDPAAPNCSRTVGTIPAGEAFAYLCDTYNVDSTFSNVAEACGKSVLDPGVVVCNSDSADVNVVSPSGAAIAIDKAPAGQAVFRGADAIFTITVENSGLLALAQVAVSDALAPACSRAIGSLDAGEVHSHTCVLSSVTEALTNTAVVSGTHATIPGEVVTGDDSALASLHGSVCLPLALREH